MKRHVLAWVLVFGGTLWAASATVNPARGSEAPLLAPEEFALLAWNRASGDTHVFETIRECGFNLAGFVRPEDFDAVADAGIKCIAYDPRNPVRLDPGLTEAEINRRVHAIVDVAGTHPAVFGYYLADEPGTRQFAVLAKWVRAFKSASPDRISYINLFPNYASEEQLDAPGYTRYLESFINIVKLPYLSYDHYALLEDGTQRKSFFENFALVRESALRHKLPFWYIGMATGCLSYAEPTEAGLRYQAYSALAYGARGLSWFTYFSANAGNYRLAPIDHFGEKTATWHMLRRVNLQVHRLGPTYTKLTSVNVFHHPDPPDGCEGLAGSRHLAEVAGGRFLVGEFTGPENQPFVLVVNKDLARSACPLLTFKRPGAVQQVNAYTGQPVPFAGENVWLAPGQGALLMLKPATTATAAASETRAKPTAAGRSNTGKAADTTDPPTSPDTKDR